MGRTRFRRLGLASGSFSPDNLSPELEWACCRIMPGLWQRRVALAGTNTVRAALNTTATFFDFYLAHDDMALTFRWVRPMSEQKTKQEGATNGKNQATNR